MTCPSLWEPGERKGKANPGSGLLGLRETGPLAFSPGTAGSAFTQEDKQLRASGPAHSIPVS